MILVKRERACTEMGEVMEGRFDVLSTMKNERALVFGQRRWWVRQQEKCW